MSKHSCAGGGCRGAAGAVLRAAGEGVGADGQSFPIIAIQEAGLDGFWLHRVLEREGIESHVVDPASIATSRRRRRAKTDRIDGEALLRALLAYKRGEPRVCAMVKAPTPEEEDRRRLCRERKALIAERVERMSIGSRGCCSPREYRTTNRCAATDASARGDSRRATAARLPTHLKTQISRELDRLELLLDQIGAAEAERDALLAAQQTAAPAPAGRMLLRLKGIGAEFAAVLWSEGLFRQFDNRRQIAAYAGLRRRLGRADRSIASKACPRPAIHDCERR